MTRFCVYASGPGVNTGATDRNTTCNQPATDQGRGTDEQCSNPAYPEARPVGRRLRPGGPFRRWCTAARGRAPRQAADPQARPVMTITVLPSAFPDIRSVRLPSGAAYVAVGDSAAVRDAAITFAARAATALAAGDQETARNCAADAQAVAGLAYPPGSAEAAALAVIINAAVVRAAAHMKPPGQPGNGGGR